MKTKYSIILLIFGFCLDFIGALSKIRHQQYADEILIIATVLKVAGALILLYKISTYPKFRDFLNW